MRQVNAWRGIVRMPTLAAQFDCHPVDRSRPEADRGVVELTWEMSETQQNLRYEEPGWFTTNVFNRAIQLLNRLGFSVAGSRVLEVRGRKSGQPRRTPVNLLTIEGESYLVAPRGHTQWVRNLRAARRGRLLVGRRGEHFAAVEVEDDAKPSILRAYLQRWKWEVGVFFGGVEPDSPDHELRRIAPDHPVFRVRPLSD
jgi:deazaflavin-dependent oxidoreductase (nitroreductase family)